MTSSTLSRGLKAYGIAARLRALRLRKKMRLVELARHTGLSAAMLSKLERGLLFPTLPTLLRIALVFGVGLDHFFSAAASQQALGIVRSGRPDAIYRAVRRPRGGMGVRMPRLHRHRADAQCLLGQVPRAGAAAPARHPGAEFLHVLKGTLGLHLAGDEHTLHDGDSIYFDSSQSHCVREAWRRNV